LCFYCTDSSLKELLLSIQADLKDGLKRVELKVAHLSRSLFLVAEDVKNLQNQISISSEAPHVDEDEFKIILPLTTENELADLEKSLDEKDIRMELVCVQLISF